MSQGEFVVVQILSAKADGTWLDYSRCTARQALTLLGRRPSDKQFRAKHWITRDLLNESQLRRMASDELGRWAEVAPSEGEFWNVTVEFDSDKGRFALRTTLDDWSREKWGVLTRDIHAKALPKGWAVKSVRLSDRLSDD